MIHQDHKFHQGIQKQGDTSVVYDVAAKSSVSL